MVDRRRQMYLNLVRRVQVDPQTRCWVWHGPKHDGYGYTGKGFAHRVMYTIIHGDPREKVIHHTCHNRLCINPDHLQAVTKEWNDEEGRQWDRILRSQPGQRWLRRRQSSGSRLSSTDSSSRRSSKTHEPLLPKPSRRRLPRWLERTKGTGVQSKLPA